MVPTQAPVSTATESTRSPYFEWNWRGTCMWTVRTGRQEVVVIDASGDRVRRSDVQRDQSSYSAHFQNPAPCWSSNENRRNKTQRE